MEGAGIYLAPLLNLPPRGGYSDTKQVVQQLNLLNARGANMVIYGTVKVRNSAQGSYKTKQKNKLFCVRIRVLGQLFEQGC